MLTRRKFVGMTAVVATAAACRTSLPPTEDGAPVGTEELPASIASLQSMKGSESPITIDERAGRIERARKLMATHDIDAIMLTGGTSLVYFSAVQWWLSERLFALFVPRSGDPFVVCPAFEEERAREQLALGPLGDTTEVLTWEEHQDPHALSASGLRSRGIRSGRVGAEETVRFVFADGLAMAAPTIEVVSATPVTAGCRGVKDDHELELMRLASAVTLRAYDAAYRALDEGMTQDDVRELISTAHRRLGFSGGAGVQVGPYSALPHGSMVPQEVREGTILLVDGGCSVEGYRSDISRTFVLGKATDKMKQVFEIELRAQSAALAAARPGVECQAVDAAARKVIVDAGYGPDYKYFTHRVGHGMGMDGHEWPYLVRGNKLPLAPGMTFSDEPGIYIPGEFGIRLEDDMVITSDGAELMTPQSPSLEDPFASGFPA